MQTETVKIKAVNSRTTDLAALLVTAHAAQRQQERSLPDWQIEFALRWGDSVQTFL